MEAQHFVESYNWLPVSFNANLKLEYMSEHQNLKFVLDSAEKSVSLTIERTGYIQKGAKLTDREQNKA